MAERWSHPSVATDGCLQNLMHYVYILKFQEEKSKNFYIGYTSDLRKRLKEKKG